MKNIFDKKIILKLICFVLIGLLILVTATNILIPKWVTVNNNRMTYIVKGFYKEKKNSLDVVFMGNSDIYRGVSPIRLWDEYGIASYNYVSSGQRMWTAYYMMVECLKYQTPDLIVLNMDSAFNNTHSSESNYRKALDNMKLGENKIEAITDPAFGFKRSEQLSLLFPIIRYHSRWTELKDVDFSEAFKNESFAYKGMDLITQTKPNKDGYKYMEKDTSKKEITGKSEKYINKMIDLCKEKNIKLLLVELPSADSWSKDMSDKTYKFAEKHDLEFIDMNLNADDFGFDWETDTCDAGDHLNVYGAEKVSKYLGGIIQEKYNIPNRKDDSNYADWNTCSEIYHKDKKTLENKKSK